MGHLLASHPPPAWARRIAATLLPAEVWSVLEGDLNEQYVRSLMRADVNHARRRYAAEVILALLRLGPHRRPNVTQRLAYAAIVIAAFGVAGAMQSILWHAEMYRMLYRDYPWMVPEFFKNALAVVTCVLVLAVVARVPARKLAQELGLAAPVAPALLFAAAVSVPMLIGIALTHRLGVPQASLPFLALYSPWTDEVVARGFAVGQLVSRGRWPAWAAVTVAAIASGFQGVDTGGTLAQSGSQFVLTATGASVFAWLFLSWNNLWVPISLHVCMNLWWELFAAARTGVEGPYLLALQVLTMLLAIAGTLYLQRRRPHLSRCYGRAEQHPRRRPGIRQPHVSSLRPMPVRR